VTRNGRNARGANSTNTLCTRERWCTYYRGHEGDCSTEPPRRDCECEAPVRRSTWMGSDCMVCGRRIVT
jgi:hypothetical protein